MKTLTTKEKEKRKSLQKRKRKSLRQSISLHFPNGELDSTSQNYFVEMPPNVFSLTYLGSDETQNPESLHILDELMHYSWRTYLVGYIHNLDYSPEQLRTLEGDVAHDVCEMFEDGHICIDMKIVEHLSPTDNDCKALALKVKLQEGGKQDLILYRGYLMSWCSPVKTDTAMLPVLLCKGPALVVKVVHRVLSASLDCTISEFTLMQENFLHLSTYCLVMLKENDSRKATFNYRIPPGKIKVTVTVKDLLKLWKNIHKGDSQEVEFDEVFLFNQALETFFESTYGIKFGLAFFESVCVEKCFFLKTNSQMWFKSTKIAHVVLKYLTLVATQRLKVKLMEDTEDSQQCA